MATTTTFPARRTRSQGGAVRVELVPGDRLIREVQGLRIDGFQREQPDVTVQAGPEVLEAQVERRSDILWLMVSIGTKLMEVSEDTFI